MTTVQSRLTPTPTRKVRMSNRDNFFALPPSLLLQRPGTKPNTSTQPAFLSNDCPLRASLRVIEEFFAPEPPKATRQQTR